MENIRHLIEDTLVPHTAFAKATKHLDQCFEYAQNAREPICLPIVGESRTGKSRSLEYLLLKHPRTRTDDGVHIPIIYVRAPANPTELALATTILKAMGDPKYDKGTGTVKTGRLETLIEECGVRMIIVDELQHFIDKGTAKIAYIVADWLKNLVESRKVALVVAGLPSCLDVVALNEQLEGRFISPVILPRFDWMNLEHRAEFIGIITEFHEQLSKHFDLPDLSTEEMAFRFHCASGGLMGYLTKTLRQVVWQAIDEGRKVIQLHHIAEAQQIAVKMGELENPFSNSFSTAPTQKKLHSFAKLGAHIDQAISPHNKPTKKRQKVANDEASSVGEEI